MHFKKLVKKGLSCMLAATMALSSVFTTGVISPVTVYAAGDKSLPGAWDVNDESDSYPTDVPIPRNVFQLIENQEITATFNSNLPKLDTSDPAYKWVKAMEENAGEWDALKGKGVYGGTLKPDTEYAVTYSNVKLPSGKYVDVKIAVIDCSKKASWSNDPDGDGRNGGPYIVFFGNTPGALRYSYYAKIKCRITISDHGKSSLSSTVKSTWNFMDIDQRQALEISSGSMSMIRGGKMGENLKLAANSDNYKEHINNHMGGNADYTVFSTESNNASDTAGKKKFRLNLNLDFTNSKNEFTYWYYAGRQNGISETCPGNSSCDDANQYYGVYVFFGGSALDSGIPDPVSPNLTKKVNNVDNYTLTSGDEVVDYTLFFKSDDWANTLTGISLTDTLDSCLSYEGGFKVTSSALGDITSYFKDESNGNNLKFTTTSAANAAKIGGTAGTYTVSFKAKINWDADIAGHNHLLDDGRIKIANQGKITIAGPNVVPGRESSKSEEVYIYYKPSARPDPVKAVDKETLKNADETWKYTISQTFPADTFGKDMAAFKITDQIDPCLIIDDVKVYQDDSDVTANFDVQTTNNKIVASAKENFLPDVPGFGTEKTYRMEVNVRYHHTSDTNSYESHRLQDIRKHTGTLTNDDTYAHVNDDETKVTAKNNAKVLITWPTWGASWDGEKTTNTVTTSAPIPTMESPEKCVSDTDETNAESNTLTNADEAFTYTITQKIPKNVASIYRYSDLTIKDQIDTCLTIGKPGENTDDIASVIGVKVDGTDKKDLFDVSVNNNLVTVKAKPELLKGGSDNLLYGGKDLAGSTIEITVPVFIDSLGSEGGLNGSNITKLEEIRNHKHMVKDTDGNEVKIVFENEATTSFDDMITRTPAEQKTNKVVTTVAIPKIPAPVKKVSDKDDLCWDGTIKEDGEATPGPHNRVTDVTNDWIYTITQDIPEHTTGLFYYKTFSITDAVDPCLVYDEKEITIVNSKGEDCSNFFDVKKGSDNKLTITAKDEVLKSDVFYGAKAGKRIQISFPVRIEIPADEETLKELKGAEAVKKEEAAPEETEGTEEDATEGVVEAVPLATDTTVEGHLKFGNDSHVHLIKIAELIGQKGFEDLVKLNDKEYVYAFQNLAQSHINSNIVYRAMDEDAPDEGIKSQAKVKTRKTDTVQTVVETSDPDITKESSKFEWQVGDQVDYTIVVRNDNGNSIADNVVITDKDLPGALVPDNGSIQISSSYESEEIAQKSGQPADRDIMKDSTIEYVENGNENGFVITIPKLYRGEIATVTLTCTAKEASTYDELTGQWEDCLEKGHSDKTLSCVNGEVVENTASIEATLMLPNDPPTDTERVWVNTPHLNIKKTTTEKEYEVGEIVKYTLEVTNVHEGTLARDIVITDNIQTPGTTIVEGSIHLMDETGASYELGKKAGEDDDAPYIISEDDHSFSIVTGMNLRYDGDSPFKKMAEIDPKVNNIQFEGISQDEWDAPITHTKFIVTYEAKVEKEPENSNQIINVATAEGSNTELVEDDEVVYLKAPVINIEKSSDKDVYQKDEIGKYELKVTQTRPNRTAVNVVIKDALSDEDKEKADIKPDTIKTFFNGEEFEPVSINADKDSYVIDTGKNLTTEDNIVVTYDVLFLSDAKEDTVLNIAKAKAENAYAEVELDVPLLQVTPNLSARKTSNPASGTVVKCGQNITYSIDVRNDSEQTMKNVMVRDEIPAFTTYVEGSASNNGQLMTIDEKQYITYVIPTLRAGSTKRVKFTVTVNEGTDPEEIILNTAEVRETSVEELNEDGTIPEELWNDDFKPTNTTKHPLSNWAVDTNEVKLQAPDITIEKKAKESKVNVGDDIHWTIVVEEKPETVKVTNLVVEDKKLPEGVKIDYKSIRVDGKEVPVKKTVERNAASIHMVKTTRGFKIVYPALSGKSKITFTSKVISKKLAGKTVKNVATAISDQTPLKKASDTVKIPKTKVVKSPVSVIKTGDTNAMFIFGGIAVVALIIGCFLFFRKKKQ